MAQQTLVELVDDLDPTGETIAAETVRFGLDGAEFEIDLSEDNAGRLRDVFDEFIPHARRTGGRKQRKLLGAPAAAGGKPKTSPEAAQIREWANANGYGLPERGRIAAHIVEAYRQAQVAEPAKAPRRRKPAAKARK